MDLRRVSANFENKFFHEANSKVNLLSPLLADQLVSFTYDTACAFQLQIRRSLLLLEMQVFIHISGSLLLITNK
jgi:hypothetical protein